MRRLLTKRDRHAKEFYEHAARRAPPDPPRDAIRRRVVRKYPDDQPVTTFDAHDLQSLFQAAYTWLASNYELVNRLNVFPVPDGDTGTNMLLTIKSAWVAIRSRSHATVGEVAEAAAEGAHHGSRGNSGVILGDPAGSARTGEKSPQHARPGACPAHGDQTARCASPAEGRWHARGQSGRGGRAENATCVNSWRRSSSSRRIRASHAGAAAVPAGSAGGKAFLSSRRDVHSPGSRWKTLPQARSRSALNVRNAALSPLPPSSVGFDVQYLIEQPNKR
jgi:hypothetical protein